MAGDRDFDIPDTGAVFTFGRSRFADNVASHFYIRNDPVVEVACGDEHTAVICKKGRVFVFGNNDYGQLGLGHKNVVVKPSCVKSLKPEKAVHVACGRAHTVISTDSGKVFAWGSNSDGQLGVGDTKDQLEPVEVFGIPDTITQLSAGCLSSAALTANGEVYVWGSNSDGQLGLADTTENVLQPALLPFDQHVVYISCGYYHTALVTESGALYTCGESETGKLGLPNSVINVTPPQKVPMAAPVRSVACGGNHTVALTENGEVFAFGNNFNGQLGLGKETTQSVLPMRVTALEKNIIKFAACGESHTAFITKAGQLFTCGEGRHGKICNELDFSNSQTTPVQITRFRGFTVQKAACGGCHTMVLAYRKEDHDGSSLDSDTGNLENMSAPSQTPLPPLQRVPAITSPVGKLNEDPGGNDLLQKPEINGGEGQEKEETQSENAEQENDSDSTKKNDENKDGDSDKLSEKSERLSKRSAALSERSDDLSLKIDENEDAESLSNKSSSQERDQSSQATGIVENSEPEEDIKEADDIKESAKNGSNGSEEEDNGDVKTEKPKAQGPVARFFSSLRRRSAKPSPTINASQQKTNSAGGSDKAQVPKGTNEEGERSSITSGKLKGCRTENKSKTCTLL